MMDKTLTERRQALAQQYFYTIKLELEEARAYWEGKRESPHFDSDINTPEESILRCMCHYSNALWLIDKLEGQYKALSPQYEERGKLSDFCQRAQEYIDEWQAVNSQLCDEHKRQEPSFRALALAQETTKYANLQAFLAAAEAAYLKRCCLRYNHTEEGRAAAEEAEKAAKEAQKAAKEAEKLAEEAEKNYILEQREGADKAQRDDEHQEWADRVIRKMIRHGPDRPKLK